MITQNIGLLNDKIPGEFTMEILNNIMVIHFQYTLLFLQV